MGYTWALIVDNQLFRENSYSVSLFNIIKVHRYLDIGVFNK